MEQVNAFARNEKLCREVFTGSLQEVQYFRTDGARSICVTEWSAA
jgi:hypothetical protein